MISGLGKEEHGEHVKHSKNFGILSLESLSRSECSLVKSVLLYGSETWTSTKRAREDG